ncbi:unnamed protein product [Cuscuta epithymum]|uniref:RING-type domain-containing protein n=1 Tax=Cuscuta epithymum TaxID=186058 RepID=A0AAV0FB93_9ASTE|nr:unnamed protein product [Cuscuta epithymum]
MTCPLCSKLFRDATTISECLHTFCRRCIYKKLSDEETECCPICNIDLGCVPLEKLRADHNLQDVRAKIFPYKRRKVMVPEVLPSVMLPAKRKERSLSSGMGSFKEMLSKLDKEVRGSLPAQEVKAPPSHSSSSSSEPSKDDGGVPDVGVNLDAEVAAEVAPEVLPTMVLYEDPLASFPAEMGAAVPSPQHEAVAVQSEEEEDDENLAVPVDADGAQGQADVAPPPNTEGAPEGQAAVDANAPVPEGDDGGPVGEEYGTQHFRFSLPKGCSFMKESVVSMKFMDAISLATDRKILKKMSNRDLAEECVSAALRTAFCSDELGTRAIDFERKYNALSGQFKAYDQDIAKAFQEREAAQKKCEGLHAQMDELKSYLDRALKTAQGSLELQLEAEKRELEALNCIQELHSSNEALKDDCALLRKTLEVVRTERGALADKLAFVEMKLVNVRNDLSTAHDKVDAAAKYLEEAQQRARDMTAG